MLAAQQLAKDINNYEKNFRKTVGKDLKLGLYIRKLMNKFTKDDYNRMIALCKKEKVLRILNTANRDYPGSFIFKLIMAEPRFLRFGLNLFY